MAAQASCSAKQLSQLDQAARVAGRRASSAHVANTTAAATWFGAYNARRYQTIAGNFKKIAAATSRLTYNCVRACKGYSDRTYAYAIKPYGVTICPPFWNIEKNGGYYSKPFGLVHETSHLVADTGDIYGEEESKKLAKTDPAKAAQNADNYAYFSASAQ